MRYLPLVFLFFSTSVYSYSTEELIAANLSCAQFIGNVGGVTYSSCFGVYIADLVARDDVITIMVWLLTAYVAFVAIRWIRRQVKKA